MRTVLKKDNVLVPADGSEAGGELVGETFDPNHTYLVVLEKKTYQYQMPSGGMGEGIALVPATGVSTGVGSNQYMDGSIHYFFSVRATDSQSHTVYLSILEA